VEVVSSDIVTATKAACCHHMKRMNKRSWLAMQAKVLGTVRNPDRSWDFGLLKINTQIIRSGLCSWHRANAVSPSAESQQTVPPHRD